MKMEMIVLNTNDNYLMTIIEDMNHSKIKYYFDFKRKNYFSILLDEEQLQELLNLYSMLNVLHIV